MSRAACGFALNSVRNGYIMRAGIVICIAGGMCIAIVKFVRKPETKEGIALVRSTLCVVPGSGVAGGQRKAHP